MVKNVGSWLKDQQRRWRQARPPRDTPGPRLREADAVSARRRASRVSAPTASGENAHSANTDRQAHKPGPCLGAQESHGRKPEDQIPALGNAESEENSERKYAEGVLVKRAKS